MACCAFAVYLLSQLLLPLRWLRDLVRGPQAASTNAATAWSPGSPAWAVTVPSASPRARRWPIVVGLIGLEAAAALAATISIREPTPSASAGRDFYAALHTSICRALGRQPS